MKKTKKYIKIGEQFEENKRIEQGYYTEFKTLKDCYGKWSDAKENIFNHYYNLLKDNSTKVMEYGIRSYNPNVIILHAIVKKGKKTLYLVITPTHNHYKEMEEE